MSLSCPNPLAPTPSFPHGASVRRAGTWWTLPAALLPLAAAACLLGACTSSGPKVEVDKDAVSRYRSAGYAHTLEENLVVQRISPTVTQLPWTYTITRPAGTGPARPIIIFLPALGEADNSACRWVELWARAGYAVLTIQALDDDAQIWTTSLARSGDFERVARARFTDDLMADRVARLAHLLSQVKARSQGGDQQLAGLDWDRVALAGADLGAYTVQSIASSTPEQLRSLAWPLSPLAFLAVSPYARQSAADAGVPLHASAPLMMVSSRDDVDAYGVVTSVTLRHAAFDRLSGGDDYFLELAATSHRWLSGVAPSQSNAEAAQRPRPAFADETPSQRARSKSGGDNVAPGEYEDLAPDLAAKQAATRAERDAQLAKARSRQLTQQAMSEVGFEDVSVAFFDANLRRDARARGWLADAAPAWLQNGDRLKHR